MSINYKENLAGKLPIGAGSRYFRTESRIELIPALIFQSIGSASAERGEAWSIWEFELALEISFSS